MAHDAIHCYIMALWNNCCSEKRKINALVHCFGMAKLKWPISFGGEKYVSLWRVGRPVAALHTLQAFHSLLGHFCLQWNRTCNIWHTRGAVELQFFLASPFLMYSLQPAWMAWLTHKLYLGYVRIYLPDKTIMWFCPCHNTGERWVQLGFLFCLGNEITSSNPQLHIQNFRTNYENNISICTVA